jgi:uncharacterized iron-regulated membrane protein
MKGGLRVSMSWLHTWTGLICGWLVFAVFATGTASVFKPEIGAWTRPVLAAHADPAAALQRAADALRREHPEAVSFTVAAPGARDRDMESYWSDAKGGFGQAWRDPATGAPVAGPRTSGGELFYRFHFELMAPYPFGRLAACLAAAFFLSAIISGVITHKRIFADFFTFRPAKGGQRAWLDGHNVLGVLALPFHLFIALTGIVTLLTTFMPFGPLGAYGQDTAAFVADAAPATANLPVATGRPAPLAPIAPMAAAARARFADDVLRMTVEKPGDAAARVIFFRDNAGRVSRAEQAVVFDGVSGEILSAPPAPGPAMATYEFLYGLHMAEFAGPALRWLYFLGGLSGCGLIATGLVLWTVSRRRKLARPHFGFRLVEVMNAGVVMGLTLAVAGFFWASRLLPAGLADRPAAERHVFVATLAATVVYSVLRPQRRAWAELATASAVLFAGAPLVSALSGGRNLLRSAQAGDLAMVGADLTLLALGAGFAFIAVKAARV